MTSRRTLGRVAAAALVTSLAVGCGASEASGPTKPTTTTAKPSKAKSAYPAERVVSIENLGPASGDFEVTDDSGQRSLLSSSWEGQYAVVVFYRGHW